MSHRDVRQYNAIRLRLRSGKGRLTAAAAAVAGTSDPAAAAAAAAAVEGAMDGVPSLVMGLLGAVMMGDDDDAMANSFSPLLGGGIHGLGAGMAGGSHGAWD